VKDLDLDLDLRAGDLDLDLAHEYLTTSLVDGSRLIDNGSSGWKRMEAKHLSHSVIGEYS
jgi:hypothetical protein